MEILAPSLLSNKQLSRFYFKSVVGHFNLTGSETEVYKNFRLLHFDLGLNILMDLSKTDLKSNGKQTKTLESKLHQAQLCLDLALPDNEPENIEYIRTNRSLVIKKKSEESLITSRLPQIVMQLAKDHSYKKKRKNPVLQTYYKILTQLSKIHDSHDSLTYLLAENILFEYYKLNQQKSYIDITSVIDFEIFCADSELVSRRGD